MGQGRKLCWNLADRAGDQLGEDATAGQYRQQDLEFLVPHQRFAADDRDVQRLLLIDQCPEVVDQFLSLEIPHLPQGDVAAEMIVSVRVAARTPQWALARNFD